MTTNDEDIAVFELPEGDLTPLELRLAQYIVQLSDKGLLKQRDIFVAQLAMDLAHATAVSSGDGKASSSGTAKQLMEVYDRLPNPYADQGLAGLLGDDDDDDDYS